MRKVAGNWVGRITGTNNGNVFVELKQDQAKLYGVARINEPVFGVALYNFVGVLENESVAIELVPDAEFLKQTNTQEILVNNQRVKIAVPKVDYGNVILDAKLINNATLEGTWKSTIGTGGNVFLKNEKAQDSEDIDKTKEKDNKMIFISYSHVDKDHLKRLHVHLKPLENKGLVDIWDDTKIRTGQKWREVIEIALSKAAIAILVISADFLASDFIIENELPPILKKAELGGTRILPIILKPCRFSRETHLSQFQALNTPDKPLLSLSDIEQEEMWDKLSQTIEIELNR
ncbi:MAG: toll/interleukin-1 receptor domain-containing protein [Gammaproteobacteria bacterium]|nr:toll/interleukin-1 receptor domain-containing protein [Gammaproteobacteria bacterium]